MLALLVARHCNFLLLDEPLNHLDLSSQEAFEAALSEFEGTILAIAHDRYFIDRFAQVTWYFTPEGLTAELSRGFVREISSILENLWITGQKTVEKWGLAGEKRI